VLDRELMIVALTANASEEDRARYLASGMDNFLSKPVDEAALHAQISLAIERQLRRAIALAPMPPAGAARVPAGADLDAMFGVLTGPTPLAVAVSQNAGRRNSDLKARMRVAFAGDLPGRRAELEQAIAGHDHDAAARLLHGVKGSAAYLDATELHLLCGELELAADQRQWGVIAAALPRLRRLLDDFEGGAC
jgi:HPt (histidine-containing phosphotransfer) domain-containing protein